MTTLEIIPEARREAARAALKAAFGSDTPDALRAVTGGASGAHTFRIEAGGRAYLLRLESPERNILRQPARAFACMQSAADAGLAPPVRFADADTGVVIMDFIEERPIAEYPGGHSALLTALGEMAARLQQTPVFPAVARYDELIRRTFAWIGTTNLFAPGLLTPHTEGFERFAAAYPWDEAAQVSSHNDLNARNVLFDGQKLWLVDWELSFANDPLVDVAILADNFAPTPEQSDILLRAWAGREPDAPLRARLTLMWAMSRMFYAGIILGGFAAAPTKEPITDLFGPDARRVSRHDRPRRAEGWPA